MPSGLTLVLFGPWTGLCGKHGRSTEDREEPRRHVCVKKTAAAKRVVSREWSRAGDAFLKDKKGWGGVEGIYKQNRDAMEWVNAEMSKRGC